MTIIDKLANALERLSITQSSTIPQETFKAPNFTGEINVENFTYQFQEMAAANEWSNAATLLHIHKNLTDGARDCGRYPTSDKVLETLFFKYELTVREARTCLSNLRRDIKVSSTDLANEVNRLVKAAYADVP